MSHFNVIVIGSVAEQLAPFQENNMGDWENPNAKWDYWTVGGRWSDRFPLKSGGRASSALKSAIDVEKMMDEAEARAREAWSFWAPALDGNPRPESWTTIRRRHAPDIGTAREVYHAQPAIVAWNAEYRKRGEHAPFRCNPVEDYGFDLDDYVVRMRRQAPAPFAFVNAGEWHEMGRMGFWAVVSDEEDATTWVEEWEAFWAALPDTALVTVVDCHVYAGRRG